ncbi:MAG: J domain-containing protein [Chloroherpetonaceae bacterium]
MSNSLSSERFKNYYEVLRVRPYDPPELIQAAFVAQIKQWHPDRFANADPLTKQNAEERAKLILEAKRILLTPSLKAEYDQAFEARFPRRWEKLSSRARPKQRQVTVEDLLKNGVPINPLTQTDTSELNTFKWLSFSTRVNYKTRRVVFSVSHFFAHNPDCEVRFRFHYNQDWTPFSKQKLYAVDYNDDVALVEMQARYILPSKKIRYSPCIFKVVVLTDYERAMQRRREIQQHITRLRNRMVLKLIIVVLGSALFAAETLALIASAQMLLF